MPRVDARVGRGGLSEPLRKDGDGSEEGPSCDEESLRGDWRGESCGFGEIGMETGLVDSGGMAG